MGYVQLTGINLQHEYFGEKTFSAFRITPTPKTEKICSNFGLKIKHSGRGINIVWDDENAAFSTLNRDDQKAFKVTFYLEITDPLFFNYSDLGINEHQGIFHYSNIYENQDANASVLSRQNYTSAEDHCQLTGNNFMYAPEEPAGISDFQVTNLFDEQAEDVEIDEGSCPNIILNLRNASPGFYSVKKEGNTKVRLYKDTVLFWKPVFGVIELFPFVRLTGFSEILNGQSIRSRLYTINFKARSTIWRYYIISKHAPDVGDVVVSNGRAGGSISFINKGRQRLSDGSEALVFDSESAIVLEKEVVNMYQLKSDTGRTLIKPLPTPSVHFINAKTEKDQQYFFSEMYVYL